MPRMNIAAAVVVTISTAFAEDLSNRHLVSIMPSDIESVMVLLPQQLASERSAFGREFSGFTMAPDADPAGMDRTIGAAVAELGIAKLAIAGSNFTSPRSTGGGSFTSLTIWAIDKSAALVRDKLQNEKDKSGVAETFEHFGKAVFRGKAAAQAGTGKPGEIFVSFLSDHVVAMTQDRAHIEHLAAVFDSANLQVPAQWADISVGLEFESPAILLRKYNAKNDNDINSPVSGKRPQRISVDIDSMSLVVPSVDRIAFTLRCKSPTPDRAVSFYRSAEMSFYVLPELLWDWKTTTTREGFEAEIQFRNKPGENHHFSIVLSSLFGMNMDF